MSIWLTMKRIIILLSFLVIIPSPSFADQFRVNRVYDGGIIKAKNGGIEIKVRLVGIDAPGISNKKRETGQRFSQRSRKHLAALILNKTVDIKGYGLDGNNRLLGVVFVNGMNVNLEMVRSGMAEVNRGKPPRGFNIAPYRHAEQEARTARRGIWSQDDKYMSPKKWQEGKGQSDSLPPDLPAYRYYISPRELEERERKSGIAPPYTPPYRQK
jgi:micrococcal nuclease